MCLSIWKRKLKYGEVKYHVQSHEVHGWQSQETFLLESLIPSLVLPVQYELHGDQGLPILFEPRVSLIHHNAQ